MLKFCKMPVLCLLIIFAACNIAVAGGLSSTFVEVELTGLKPGGTYSVEEKTGMPLAVDNTTESKIVDIGIKPEKPQDYNLVPGYEPIPDLSWVTIEKDYFKKVGPKQSAKTDILISIPDDKKYAGKDND